MMGRNPDDSIRQIAMRILAVQKQAQASSILIIKHYFLVLVFLRYTSRRDGFRNPVYCRSRVLCNRC
jgi:hypothetical protein